MTLSELLDPERGFIVKDACIVGVEVYVCKSTHEKAIIQPANLTASTRPEPELEEGQHQNVVETLDFKGVGQIEKAFIPLLEEVCSQHPSLILCQEKKTRRFREWAFTALGRVLYFLKTRKVRDMNDLACKNLQKIWEELQPFNFNLTWLEPCVQSALEKKSYLEKLKEAEKLRDNVVALELELERLMVKAATVEINLDAARNLLEEEDFEEMDLDAELGFLKP
jgi:speckle-type POZ protein